MGILTVLGDYIKNTFSKLNEYKILQLIWVIAIYYFVLNSIFDFIERFVEKTVIITLKQSNAGNILEYNKIIINFLQEYEVEWIVLTILIFLTSIIVITVADTLFEDYIFIRSCSRYGGNLSKWSLIIYVTYKLYIFSGPYYGIVLFVISIIVYLIKEKKNSLLSKNY